MSDHKRYNLTLTVVDPSERDRFRSLSRPETFFEIKPGTSPGERGAYSVMLTDEEYERARRDAADPGVNLIAVEPDQNLTPDAVPGAPASNYLAMSGAEAQGLRGNGVRVGVLDSGCEPEVANGLFAGRSVGRMVTILEDGSVITYNFPTENEWQDAPSWDYHGTKMCSLAVPSRAFLVVGANANYSEAALANVLYWMVDEQNIDVLNMSFGKYAPSTTPMRDAVAHAVASDVLVFASRGNEPRSDPHYPAALPGVHAISGFSATADAPHPSTSFGDVFAASVWNPITWLTNGAVEETTATGGTSSASALATRAAAMLMSGGKSPGTVRDAMAKTARRTGASAAFEGNGVLQVVGAANDINRDTPPDGEEPCP